MYIVGWWIPSLRFGNPALREHHLTTYLPYRAPYSCSSTAAISNFSPPIIHSALERESRTQLTRSLDEFSLPALSEVGSVQLSRLSPAVVDSVEQRPASNGVCLCPSASRGRAFSESSQPGVSSMHYMLTRSLEGEAREGGGEREKGRCVCAPNHCLFTGETIAKALMVLLSNSAPFSPPLPASAATDTAISPDRSQGTRGNALRHLGEVTH